MLPQFTAEYRDLLRAKGHEPPRLLWIDDEIRVTDPCVRLLELEGYRVECVATGTEALIKIEHSAYDGIILDLRLHNASGLDVLDALRALGMRSPVLVLTGWADWESGVAAMKRGAWDYRSKTTMLTGEWLEVVKAHAIGVSASHFGRVVHTDTGLNYRHLRRAATLKAAIREILLTDEQVAQIGLRLGFRHASQFAREVHETFGLSPRPLRRLWRRIGAHHP